MTHLSYLLIYLNMAILELKKMNYVKRSIGIIPIFEKAVTYRVEQKFVVFEHVVFLVFFKT